MNALRSISVTRALAAYTRQQNCSFTIGGTPEKAAVVLAPEVFLPVIALRADAWFRAMMERPMPGIEFKHDPESMLGVYAAIDPLTGDDYSSFRIALFVHSAKLILGLVPDAEIECQPIYEAYRDGLLTHVEKGGRASWPLGKVSHR